MNKNPVLTGAEFVATRARDVVINHAALERLAARWVKKKVTIPDWPDQMHLEGADTETVLTYLIVLDSLNFCFWSISASRWHVSYNAKEYNGYFALSLALRRYFETYPQRANFSYFSTFSWKEFQDMLAGGGELQFLRRRWQILREVSTIMVKKYTGSGLVFVRNAKGSAARLVAQVAKLPSFEDYATYDGRTIAILKRAQIVVCDIHGAFRGRGPGKFLDIGYLTAFADYKVPQILHTYGVLQYSLSLTRTIVAKKLIPAGSKKEVEIRLCMVWAVELLRQALLRHKVALKPFQIDWVLWNESQKKEMVLPYHRTKTIFY